MGKLRVDGPGLVGFVAATTAILAMAVSLWTIRPKIAHAEPIIDAGEDVIILRKQELIDLGTQYLQSTEDRETLLDALKKAQDEIVRLQKMTNCS